MKDVMVDLETMGSAPGAIILSIGAVGFDPALGLVAATRFYTVISHQSCRLAGLTHDADTLAWWKQQSVAARQVLLQAMEAGTELASALGEFNAYLGGFGPDLRLWGNGADFDNALLACAYRAVGLAPAWRFYNNRCYRTLKNLRPGIGIHRQGAHHNALDDAVSQAEHAVRLFAALGEAGNTTSEVGA